MRVNFVLLVWLVLRDKHGILKVCLQTRQEEVLQGE